MPKNKYAECGNPDCKATKDLWGWGDPDWLCGRCMDRLIRNADKCSQAEWDAAEKSGKALAELIARL